MPDNPDKKQKNSSARDQWDDWDDWDDDEEGDDESRGFARMGFLEHLYELRDRIFKAIIALLVGIVICWNFVDFIWAYMEGPARQMLRTSQEKSLTLTKKAEDLQINLPRFPRLPDELRQQETEEQLRDWLNDWRDEANEDLRSQLQELLVSRDSKLMQTSITEAFFLKVKLAFLAGLILMYPFIVFQVWAFVAPGLYSKERKVALPFIVFSTLFFLGGVAFAYYIAVPFAGTFLMSFGQGFVQMITIDKYMDFLITMMIGLGIVFEIPMAIFLMAKMGIATPRWLINNFRYAVLVIVIVAAFVTPTGDPVNLAVFSVPMILLYGLGIGIAAIWGPKDKDEDERWDDDDWDEDDDPDGGGDDDDSGDSGGAGDDGRAAWSGSNEKSDEVDDPYDLENEVDKNDEDDEVDDDDDDDDDEDDSSDKPRSYRYLQTWDDPDREEPKSRIEQLLSKSGAVKKRGSAEDANTKTSGEEDAGPPRRSVEYSYDATDETENDAETDTADDDSDKTAE